jgi:hypothetical protein
MRKVINSTYVSLNGVMEQPQRWSLDYHNDESIKCKCMGEALTTRSKDIQADRPCGIISCLEGDPRCPLRR